MARIRTIKPDFFRHEGLFEAEQSSALPLRVAFAGLFTAADREGRFVWAPRALKLDCLPYDEIDFEQVLNALFEHGFIVKYEIDGKTYGCIPSWKSHQHVNIREASSTIPDASGACTCAHVTARGEGKGREGKGKEIVPSLRSDDDSVSREAPPPTESPKEAAEKYEFESGVICLNKKDFDAWEKAFSYLDLRAELTQLASWAQHQKNWFSAVSGALAKRNREQKTIADKSKAEPFKWRSNIEGVL